MEQNYEWLRCGQINTQFSKNMKKTQTLSQGRSDLSKESPWIIGSMVYMVNNAAWKNVDFYHP